MTQARWLHPASLGVVQSWHTERRGSKSLSEAEKAPSGTALGQVTVLVRLEDQAQNPNRHYRDQGLQQSDYRQIAVTCRDIHLPKAGHQPKATIVGVYHGQRPGTGGQRAGYGEDEHYPPRRCARKLQRSRDETLALSRTELSIHGLATTGYPAPCHALQPPLRGVTFENPLSSKIRAARALTSSFAQLQ
jgi:hypothetical protein